MSPAKSAGGPRPRSHHPGFLGPLEVLACDGCPRFARRSSGEGRQPLGSAVPHAGPRSDRHAEWGQRSPGTRRSEGGGAGGHAASWPSPMGVPSHHSPLLLVQSLSEVGSRLPARFSPLRLPGSTRGPGLHRL
ncbi:hypothetical protein NDU88_003683 [Pleurodeles waltl]|uniref:Uncharacterized protein n=1 Tax=Pleurodeles waltl TaxID=8319 RepID=A0AAV7NLB5_PLEWA|nr:hypothetical protein NDU88_003683 [Pleurodeles waltl]